MNPKKNRPAPAGLDIPAAVANYKRAAKALATAMEDQRAAMAAASAMQADLEDQRKHVAHLMRRHGLNNVRTCGLLVSVSEVGDGFSAVEDRFTTLAAD